MNAHLSKPLDFNKLKNILARIKKTELFRYSLCSTTIRSRKDANDV